MFLTKSKLAVFQSTIILAIAIEQLSDFREAIYEPYQLQPSSRERVPSDTVRAGLNFSGDFGHEAHALPHTPATRCWSVHWRAHALPVMVIAMGMALFLDG